MSYESNFGMGLGLTGIEKGCFLEIFHAFAESLIEQSFSRVAARASEARERLIR